MVGRHRICGASFSGPAGAQGAQTVTGVAKREQAEKKLNGKIDENQGVFSLNCKSAFPSKIL
jgi:hypothetical protein